MSSERLLWTLLGLDGRELSLDNIPFLLQQRAHMRNLLAFLAAATLTFLGAGYYLGWYSVVSNTNASGHRNLNVDINTKKIGHDLEEGASKVQKALDKNAESAPANNGQIALPPSLLDPAHKATTPVSTESQQFKAFGQ